VEISKQMGRRQINLFHLLDVRCHDHVPQIQWPSASSSTWHMSWGCSHRHPIKFTFENAILCKVPCIVGIFYFFLIVSLTLCDTVQTSLRAVTEAVKTASNGEFVPGLQLACFQLVNSSTEFYEIQHSGCTLNFHE